MGLFPKVISLCTQVKDSINKENMTFNDKSKNKDQGNQDQKDEKCVLSFYANSWQVEKQ